MDVALSVGVVVSGGTASAGRLGRGLGVYGDGGCDVNGVNDRCHVGVCGDRGYGSSGGSNDRGASGFLVVGDLDKGVAGGGCGGAGLRGEGAGGILYAVKVSYHDS